MRARAKPKKKLRSYFFHFFTFFSHDSYLCNIFSPFHYYVFFSLLFFHFFFLFFISMTSSYNGIRQPPLENGVPKAVPVGSMAYLFVVIPPTIYDEGRFFLSSPTLPILSSTLKRFPRAHIKVNVYLPGT